MTTEFEGNAPASDPDIRDFQTQGGINLPNDYLQFLKKTNGGSGFIGSNYIEMWPLDKLAQYNRGYGADRYTPQLLMFGSNGGGEAFAFDRRTTDWPVVIIPFTPLDIREAKIVSKSFGSFLQLLADRDLTEIL